MPTATATITAPSVVSLKSSSTPHHSSSAVATLRSLYPRAARAFLQRDVALTHSLLSSAFSLLHPPASVTSVGDALASSRRKWDILRITFETTLYSSPPSTQDPERLPPALRANLMLSSESLIATLHSRSLLLFTPNDSLQRASSAFLPAQILVTLVLSSLKLDCTEVGRGMIEDWLAKRGQESGLDDPKGYAKVLELYCLHVLPRLQDWEYAEDFLTYERDLPQDVRKQFVASLHQLRSDAAASTHVQTVLPADPSPSPSSSSTPSRSPSPAPSDSSASSSSTHTATPRTNGRISTLTPLTPSQSPTPKPGENDRSAPPHSTSSSSIASTATSRTITPQTADRDRERAKSGKKRRGVHRSNGNGIPPNAKSRSRSATPAGGAPSPSSSLIHRAPYNTPTATESTSRSPSTLALIRASFQSLLQSMSRSRVLLYAILFVVVPIASFVFQMRKRQARARGAGGAIAGNTTRSRAVDAVRRRLRGADGQGNVVIKVWEETVKTVLDTVRMAGRGLA